jgi:NDMA-dependent alcohol dehydrogenase
MKVRAAVLRGALESWQIEVVDVDEPTDFEVEVELAYAGPCHSDHHLQDGSISAGAEELRARAKSQKQSAEYSLFPIIGGHEGSGIVTKVGSHVPGIQVGDHVAMSFMPICGSCHWCSSGRHNLCDQGASTLRGPNVRDGMYHYHVDGEKVNRMSQVGTFAEKVVCDHRSLIKIQPWQSLRAAALISCGIATGFGSVVSRGGAKPGDTVIVVGCGGVGSGALQGARIAGARIVIGVDPAPFKREQALKLGATHVFESMDEAFAAVPELTEGRMAEVCVLTVPLIEREMVAEALRLIGKDGRIVCTAASRSDQKEITLDLLHFTMFNKAILGTTFGSVSPLASIPNLLRLHESGQLIIEDVITREYRLDDIQTGYDDLVAGKNIRGVIAYDRATNG